MNKNANIMQKISAFIVKFRWVFTAIFIALTIFSVIMIPQTKVLYDLSTYTPQNGMLNKSLELMKQEFDDKGSLSIMFVDVSLDEADTLRAQLSSIEGVQSVSFDSEQSYKNSEALFNIILSDYDSTDGANATIERIIDFSVDKEAYLAGQSTSAYYTRKTTEDEVLSIGIVVAILVILVLLFTSKTFFELLIMLMLFGITALINYGTNFLLGEISYISDFIGIILQLVLTIDYSVILLHKFLEERETNNPKQAASIALGKGIPEILSSSLTTIAGMCALMLMTLPIGREIGLALTKGIVISILSAILLMPALLVFFSKPIEKTKHKSFVPNVTKPAKKLLSARFVIVSVFAVVVTLACVGQFYNSYYYDMNGSSAIVSQRERISQNFGTMNTLVVIIPNDDIEKEKQLTDFVLSKPLIDSVASLNTIALPDTDIRLKDKLTASEFTSVAKNMGFSDGGGLVEKIIGAIFNSYIEKYDPETTLSIDEYKIMLADLLVFVYENDYLPDAQAQQFEPLMLAIDNFESENYSRLMFNIDGHVEGAETFALIEELLGELGQFYGENNFYLAGESVMNYEMDQAFPVDNTKVLVFTAVFILLILLFSFRNFLLPLIMMLTIQGGIWLNFAIPFVMGNSMLFLGYLIISAIQMGATIDYAIILTNRFQTTKSQYIDLKDAMASSINAVFPTIITSGVILTATGFILGIATSEPSISSIGMLLGIGALLSVVLVLFVLPQLLFVFNKPIDKCQITFRRKKKTGKDNFHFLENDQK